MSETIVIAREDSGKLIEQANYVGGKWTIFWTSIASKARLFSEQKADELVQGLIEDGIYSTAFPVSEYKLR